MTGNPTRGHAAPFEDAVELIDLCLPEIVSIACATLSDDQKFNVRIVNSDHWREAASLLISKMYSWRGYSLDQPLEHDPNKITLIADVAGKPVGTMTLCFDGCSGLPADDTFRDKLDGLRAQGHRLCEPSRLAISKEMPKTVFASMIHISYLYAHQIHGATDYVIQVNPRHVSFYKSMLGFCDIGEERICPRVSAPALLLGLKLDYMAGQIQKYGGLERRSKVRSFYPYFLSRWEEPGITDRLLF